MCLLNIIYNLDNVLNEPYATILLKKPDYLCMFDKIIVLSKYGNLYNAMYAKLCA